MHVIGMSFNAPLSTEQVQRDVIDPLRVAMEGTGVGIYSNYLRKGDGVSPEHVVVFEVLDFKTGLRTLRLAASELDLPPDLQFHNLDPTEPPY
ncbi:MAG: hypothetical protein KDA61_04355 [Planctomycetales bacterium]|nr:hypothetical protein [Planctomycetales bacterium]